MPQTLYIVTYPAGGGTPSNAQIVAGQNASGAAASWAGNATWTGSGQYLEATGLSASTEYDSAAVIYDGTTYSNVVEVSGTWTTLSSGVTVTCTPGATTAAGIQAGISQDITLATNLGNAVAAGTTASVAQAVGIACSPGAATAAGITAGVTQAIALAATLGNATAAGTHSAIQLGSDTNIIAVPGAAVAAGIPATVTQQTDIIITATAGSATADGISAGVTQAITIQTTADNALAAGITAGIDLAGGIDITCSVGGAVAAGTVAQVLVGMTIGCQVGDATADGTVATIRLSDGSGVTLSPEDIAAIADAVWAHSTAVDFADKMLICSRILRNKTVTNPTTGVMTVYADDGTTPYLTAQLHENVAETQTYRGQGAEVRDRLQ